MPEVQPNGADQDAPLDVRGSILEAIETLKPAEEVEDGAGNPDPATDQEPDSADAEGLAADAGDADAEGQEPDGKAEAVPDGDQDTDADPDGAAAEREEPEEVILAPASWSKEDREIFDKLGEDAKKVVARRETERDRHLNTVSSEMAPLRHVVEENQDYFRQIGVTPDQSFRALVQAEKSLRFGTPQAKAEALQQIARDYGIPLQSPAQGQQDDYADPGLARLEQTFTERLGNIESQLSSRQQAEGAAQQREAETTAQRFFDTLEGADPKEFPEARYVEQVMPQFQGLVAVERSGGANPDVDRLMELYRAAALSIPDVRNAVESDIAARQKAAKAAEERRTVRTVKKTSSSASGGGSAIAHSDDPNRPRSVREDVELAKRQVLEAQQ